MRDKERAIANRVYAASGAKAEGGAGGNKMKIEPALLALAKKYNQDKLICRK